MSQTTPINQLIPIPSNIGDYDSLELDIREYGINEILKMAEDGKFPKKQFLINSQIKAYTPRLHFFMSLRKFAQYPKDPVQFECKICHAIKTETFPYFSNLNHHLKNHIQFRTWLEKFDKKEGINGAVIDNHTLRLIKYIISSNSSLAQLQNPSFTDLFQEKFKVPSYKVFRNTLLPNIMQKLFKIIDSKLNRAVAICLVVDMWSNNVNANFIAVVAILTNEYFDREIVVIGMKEMPGGSHTSEIVKQLVENIVNDLSFNKSKINGNSISEINNTS